MGEYAEDEIARFEWLGEGDDDECDCVRPVDNDQGCCMRCGKWINYSDNA